MSRILTMARAGREALDWEMERRDEIFVLGEDVYNFGGIFGTADGFGAKYGPERVINTPISETGFIGMAAGAAMAGMHPVIDLAYIDFIGVCYNVLLNTASKTHYMSAGQVKVPMTLMIGTGGGYNNAAQHSQCLHATVAHIPGVKVVYPSNAYDAKGLLIQSIRDNDPVIFCEHKNLYTHAVDVPAESYTIPFGEAAISREGKSATIVTYGLMVHRALEAAETLAKEKIDVEVIDLRTLSPIDLDTVIESVEKTGRLVAVDEANPRCSIASDVIASVMEHAFKAMKSAPRAVTAPHTPVPFSPTLEDLYIPSAAAIAEAVRGTMK